MSANASKRSKGDPLGQLRDKFIIRDNTVQISPTGNVIIRFIDDSFGSFRCRVSSERLSAKSPYFRGMMDADRGFAEARTLSLVPEDRPGILQLVFPTDDALVSTQDGWAKNCKRLADFLLLLHGNEEDQHTVIYTNIDDLYFLAFVWDFYAIDSKPSIEEITRERVDDRGKRRRNCLFLPDWTSLRDLSLTEELDCRKLIFASSRLGLVQHLSNFTRKLIVMGSATHDYMFSDDGSLGNFNGIAWHLPGGLEEEIFARRRAILTKIGKTLDNLITSYTSNSLQCRFGYGDSLACDVFQLGQASRYLHRKRIMPIECLSHVAGQDNLLPLRSGSVFALIKELRAIPSDQIGGHHQHCGVRKDVLPILEQVEISLAKNTTVGICPFCWSEARQAHSWDMSLTADKLSSAGNELCQAHTAHLQGKICFSLQ